jgi:hypothetical protein
MNETEAQVLDYNLDLSRLLTLAKENQGSQVEEYLILSHNEMLDIALSCESPKELAL